MDVLIYWLDPEYSGVNISTYDQVWRAGRNPVKKVRYIEPKVDTYIGSILSTVVWIFLRTIKCDGPVEIL
jgi:hypothetical protein